MQRSARQLLIWLLLVSALMGAGIVGSVVSSVPRPPVILDIE